MLSMPQSPPRSSRSSGGGGGSDRSHNTTTSTTKKLVFNSSATTTAARHVDIDNDDGSGVSGGEHAKKAYEKQTKIVQKLMSTFWCEKKKLSLLLNDLFSLFCCSIWSAQIRTRPTMASCSMRLAMRTLKRWSMQQQPRWTKTETRKCRSRSRTPR